MSYINQVSLHDNQSAKDFKITPNGYHQTGGITRLGGSPFSGTSLDTFKHTLTVTGSGTGTVGSGIITLATGTTANSTVALQSTKVQRYITGNDTRVVVIAAFGDTGTTNNVRRIGIYGANDGYFFQLSGTTFSLVSRKSAVDTAVNNGSFNGLNGTSYTVDTNYHRFEIHYTLGRSYFYIDDKLIHAANFGATVLTANMQFPWQVENINSGGSTSNVSLFVRGWTTHSIGADTLVPDHYVLNGVAETRTLKQGGGRLQRILATSPGTGNQTITFYDNTAGSGLLLAVIDITAVLGTLEFNVNFVTGLTYVSTTTSGAVTIIWE